MLKAMSKQCELRSKVGGLALQPRSEGSRCIGDLIAFVDTAARQQRALAGEAPLALMFGTFLFPVLSALAGVCRAGVANLQKALL